MRKSNRILIFIFILSLLPIGIIVANYFFSIKKLSYDFQRKIDYNIIETKAFELKFNSYYIAGHKDSILYLGNYTTQNVLEIDTSLTGTKSHQLNFDSEVLHRLHVDSNNFYLSYGPEKSLYHGMTGTWKTNKVQIKHPNFYDVTALNENSFIYEYVSSRTHENSLMKTSLHASTIENDTIFKKQIDGLFCTTGTLVLSKKNNILIYVYFYRNEVLVIDTNLNLINKFHTIDPISRANLIVSNIESRNSRVLASGTIMVNARCALWNDYLLIQSKIMSKQEDEQRFKNSTVIDIYNLKNSLYISSIYLPKQANKPITQFSVIGGHIYTLSGRHLNRYTVTWPTL